MSSMPREAMRWIMHTSDAANEQDRCAGKLQCYQGKGVYDSVKVLLRI